MNISHMYKKLSRYMGDILKYVNLTSRDGLLQCMIDGIDGTLNIAEEKLNRRYGNRSYPKLNKEKIFFQMEEHQQAVRQFLVAKYKHNWCFPPKGEEI